MMKTEVCVTDPIEIAIIERTELEGEDIMFYFQPYNASDCWIWHPIKCGDATGYSCPKNWIMA